MFKLASLPRSLGAAERDLQHAQAKVRLSAVRDLPALAEREHVVAKLCEVLTSDGDADVRRAAALSLADIGDGEAVGDLTKALRDPETQVRQVALLALGEIGDGSDAVVRKAVEAFLTDEQPALRFQALLAWHQLMPNEATAAIECALSEEDAELRYLAVRLIDERHQSNQKVSEQTREKLVGLLGDEDARVRLAAALLTCSQDAPEGDAALERAKQIVTESINLGRFADHEDEQAAIETAGRFALEAARPGLERHAFGGLLKAPGIFAWQARVALARMGHERASQHILKQLSAWRRDDRTLAVVAAGQAGLAQARPTLLRMLRDEERADQDAVRTALAALE